jgi:hypothetical protein
MSKAQNSTTNRRHFLRLAGATAAATALLAAPALAVTVPVATIPDPLIALAVAERKAYRRMDRALDARDEAEGAAGGQRQFLHPWVEAGNYVCHSPSMVLAACQPNDPAGPSAEEGQALVAELRRKIRAYRRRWLAAGLGPYDREVREATREWHAAMTALSATPAVTFAGIAVKLRVIRHDFRDGATDYSGPILRSAICDAERLAGKAARS